MGYIDIRSVYRPLHFEKNQIFRLKKVNTDSLLQVPEEQTNMSFVNMQIITSQY